MSDERFRVVLGRLDSGPRSGDEEVGRRLWERIQPVVLADAQPAPAEDRLDESNREVVMLDKNTFVSPRRAWGIPIVVGIAAVAALAVAGIVVVRGDDEPSEVATIEPVETPAADDRVVDESIEPDQAPATGRFETELEMQEELEREASLAQGRLARWRAEGGDGEFVFPTDSICTWFTADVMNDIVLLAQLESWTLPVRQATFDPFGPDGCPAYDPVWSTEGWPDTDAGLRIGLSPAAADSRSSAPGSEPDDFRPHPFLHESVTYAGLEYGSWVSGISVQLRVEGHDDLLSFGLAVVDEPEGTPDELSLRDSPINRYEWLAFEVANLMLERMGWITP